MHQAVGIGESAQFFSVRTGRQDDVGQIGGLGHENVLHHQMFEIGQACSRMVGVWVGHGRILAFDIHAGDAALAGGINDFDYCQAGLAVEFCFPQGFELGMGFRVVDTDIIREAHRDQTDIGRALHVVLTAQGVEAGAATADLAGDHGQCNQATRIVGAMHVL